MLNPRHWLTIATVLGLITSGCAQTGPSNVPGDSSPFQPNVKATQPTVKPLEISLAPPAAIADPILQQYLDQLATQGFSLSTQGVWIQSDTTLLANHQGTTPWLTDKSYYSLKVLLGVEYSHKCDLHRD